jgi:Xaa-Pro dipeptidase
MESPGHHLPIEELELRWAGCRRAMAAVAPDCSGLLVFSRINLYYLTGTLASGLLWLPREGRPVLLSRKGIERARLESPLPEILPFRSFREIGGLVAGVGSPLGSPVAVEMNGLSWSLGRLLTEHLRGTELLPGDRILSRARSLKTPRELAVMAEAGRRHGRCLEGALPMLLRAGQTEQRIAHLVWEVFFAAGHQGLLRMEKPGEEVFLGHVSAGEHGNYPSSYNGPLGVRGEHPAVPYMGHAGTIWNAGELLSIDVGFSLEGYATDKTQVYWAGDSGLIPARAREAHEFCMAVQESVAARLVPGAIPSAIAADAFARAGDDGWETGFMALGGNKVPFVGHGIGLAIDENPVLAKGFDDPLEEGMVLAVEPKIGIPGTGMVGVENTFIVTAGGGRRITGGAGGIIPI